MKIFYACLCLLGLMLPYGAFIPWLIEHGPAVGLLFSEASVNRISIFAWLDVVIAAVVLVGFILSEGNRLKMKRLWIPLLATFTVGVSLGLPLFLLMREYHVDPLHPPSKPA